jgi:hypothetical protein
MKFAKSAWLLLAALAMLAPSTARLGVSHNVIVADVPLPGPYVTTVADVPLPGPYVTTVADVPLPGPYVTTVADVPLPGPYVKVS